MLVIARKLLRAYAREKACEIKNSNPFAGKSRLRIKKSNVRHFESDFKRNHRAFFALDPSMKRAREVGRNVAIT